MIAATLLFERERANTTYKKKDLPITIINAIIYALAIFAYAAFDKVLVGLVYSLVTTLFVLYLFIPRRKQYLKFPVITYTTITYLLGTIAALLIRFR